MKLLIFYFILNTIISLSIIILTIYFNLVYSFSNDVFTLLICNCINIILLPYGFIYILKYYLFHNNILYLLVFYNIYVAINVYVSILLIDYLLVVDFNLRIYLYIHLIVQLMYYTPCFILLISLPIIYFLGRKNESFHYFTTITQSRINITISFRTPLLSGNQNRISCFNLRAKG